MGLAEWSLQKSGGGAQWQGTAGPDKEVQQRPGIRSGRRGIGSLQVIAASGTGLWNRDKGLP
jgi:hypothetical protein